MKLVLVKVRDILRLIDADGWRIVAQKGSHRQFKHAVKKGRVTVPGHPNDDLHPALEKSIRQQAQL
ncbi:MAG TPA: type II toxin-antitoxin system HicA family toxin [Bryobacteraceae bacterium]